MNKEYKNCLRCGRKLKTDKAKQLGYGNTCYKKIIIQTNNNRLFDIRSNYENS